MLATDTDLLIQLDQRPVWDSCLKIIRRMALSAPSGGQCLKSQLPVLSQKRKLDFSPPGRRNPVSFATSSRGLAVSTEFDRIAIGFDECSIGLRRPFDRAYGHRPSAP